jgi:hypothetical protein
MSWDVHLTAKVDGHPIVLPGTEFNYTHNCNQMIREAGLEAWPYRVDGWKAKYLARRLREVVATLEYEPERFIAMNPDNGWGSYASLVPVLKELLGACERFPSGEVVMSA